MHRRSVKGTRKVTRIPGVSSAVQKKLSQALNRAIGSRNVRGYRPGLRGPR